MLGRGARTHHSWLQGVREHFRNQTRVITLGSWVNLYPLPPSSHLFSPSPFTPQSPSPPAFSSSMYQLSSKIYRRIDPPMIRFPWSFQMLPPLCGMQYTCSRGIGNYKIFFLFELDEDLMVPWEHHHDRIKRSICDTNLDGSFRNDEKYRN